MGARQAGRGGATSPRGETQQPAVSGVHSGGDRREFGTIPKLETQVVEEMEAGWRFEVIMISVPDMWSSGQSCSDRTPMGQLDVGARI